MTGAGTTIGGGCMTAPAGTATASSIAISVAAEINTATPANARIDTS
jgi:hypothetical protein